MMRGAGRSIDPEFQRTLTHVIFDRPLPCPHCGYSVSGMRGVRCPECGRNLRDFLRMLDTSPRRVRKALMRRALVRGARIAAAVVVIGAAIVFALVII